MTRYFGLALAMLLVACGGKDTVASKSAAAYREAPVATQTATPPPMDHSAHEMAADPHAGHDMPAPADHTAHAPHAAPQHTAHAPMRHEAHTSAAPHEHPQEHMPAAARDHGQHTMPASPAAPAVPVPPRTNAEIRNVDPASTLQPDAFDADQTSTRKQ